MKKLTAQEAELTALLDQRDNLSDRKLCKRFDISRATLWNVRRRRPLGSY